MGGGGDRVWSRQTTDSRTARAVLNICFPYTSREEITKAIRLTVEEYSSPAPSKTNTLFSQMRIRQKIISRMIDTTDTSAALPAIRESSPVPPVDRSSAEDDLDDSASSSTTLHPDSPPLATGRSGGADVAVYPNAEMITAETLDGYMYTAESPPLDIFVRTSGVERLSDFMLWQCHQDTHIFFLPCLWPEFGLWQFMKVMIEWQWRQKQKERDEKPRSKRR